MNEIEELAQSFLLKSTITNNINLEELKKDFSNSLIDEYGIGLDEYMEFLEEKILPNCVNVSSPKYIGHMTSKLPDFIIDTSKLVTTLNQNTVKLETSKVVTFLEKESIAILHRKFYGFSDEFYSVNIQNKKSTLGNITSGGTIANITALLCARNSSLSKKEGFEGIDKEGISGALKAYGYEKAVILGTESLHYSIEKAADFIGIGSNNLIKIKTDEFGKMSIEDLNQKIKTAREENALIISIIAVAGATESGMIDPIEEIAEIAKKEKIHLHVDAAWGGPIIFSDTHKDKLKGIECADSITIDGHKQLYLPMGIGCVLFKDPTLAKSIEKSANYIIRTDSYDLGRRSVEGSRPANSIYLHMALSIFGRRGYESFIDNSIRKTKLMADIIKEYDEFELLLEPEINILLYRAIPIELREKTKSGTLTVKENEKINDYNIRLQKRQKELGESFVSRTTSKIKKYEDQGIVVLRCVIANPLTRDEEIKEILKEQIEIMGKI